MVWIQGFPTPQQSISGSVPQFQANWLYLQQTIGNDHFFNNAIPALDGHHQFVITLNQAVDPAVPAGLDAVYYTKIVGTTATQPYFRNSVNVRQLATGVKGTMMLPAATTTTLTDLIGLPPFTGTFFIRDNANGGNRGSAIIFWDGVQVYYDNISINGNIQGILTTGTNIEVVVTVGPIALATWCYINLEQ